MLLNKTDRWHIEYYIPKWKYVAFNEWTISISLDFQKIVIDIIKLLTIMMNIMISLLPWAAILNFTRQNYNSIQWMNQSWQISFFFILFTLIYTNYHPIQEIPKFQNGRHDAILNFIVWNKIVLINNLINLNSLNNIKSHIDIIKIWTDL